MALIINSISCPSFTSQMRPSISYAVCLLIHKFPLLNYNGSKTFSWVTASDKSHSIPPFPKEVEINFSSSH